MRELKQTPERTQVELGIDRARAYAFGGYRHKEFKTEADAQAALGQISAETGIALERLGVIKRPRGYTPSIVVGEELKDPWTVSQEELAPQKPIFEGKLPTEVAARLGLLEDQEGGTQVNIPIIAFIDEEDPQMATIWDNDIIHPEPFYIGQLPVETLKAIQSAEKTA